LAKPLPSLTFLSNDLANPCPTLTSHASFPFLAYPCPWDDFLQIRDFSHHPRYENPMFNRAQIAALTCNGLNSILRTASTTRQLPYAEQHSGPGCPTCLSATTWELADPSTYMAALSR
jgi:hypothetical protein